MKKITVLLAGLFLATSASLFAGERRVSYYEHLAKLFLNTGNPAEEARALEKFTQYVQGKNVDVSFAPEGRPSLFEVARRQRHFRIARFIALRDRSLSGYDRKVAHYTNVYDMLSWGCDEALFVEYMRSHDVDPNFIPHHNALPYPTLLSAAVQFKRYDAVKFLLSWNADVDVSIIPEMGAHEPAWWYALPDVRMTKLLCSGTWRPQRSDLAMCVAKAVLDVSSPIRLDRMRSVECLLSSMIYESSLSKYLPPACAYAVLRRAVDCACSEDVIKALVLRCLPTYSKELSAMITQLVDGQKESGNFKDYILKILIESGVPVDNPSKLFGDLVRRYQFEEQLPEQLDLLSFFLSHVSVDSSVIYSDLHNPCVQRHTALVELLSKHSKPDDRTKLLYFIECNKPEEFKQYVAEHVVDFNFIPESHKKAPEGVDPAHWKGHSTLLGVAVKYLRLELVEYLVSQGADTMVPVQINGQYMQPLDFVLTRTDWPFITEFDKKITILLIDHGTKASEVTLKHRDIRVVLYALASNLDLIEKIDQRKVAVLLQEMPKDFKYQKVRLALVRRLPCKERLQYARVCCSVYRDYEPLKQLVMEWEPADGLGWYDLHSVIELVKDGQLQLAEALFARGLVSNTREGGRYIQSALERGDTDLAQLLKKYCMVDNPGLDQAGEGRK